MNTQCAGQQCFIYLPNDQAADQAVTSSTASHGLVGQLQRSTVVTQPQRNPWFGAPWPRDDCRAPVCSRDADFIETPVGASCCRCHELIDGHDQGIGMQGYAMEDGELVELGLVYSHRECDLRSVMGCYGHVTGTDCTHDTPYRQDALRVQAYLEQNGAWRVAD